MEKISQFKITGLSMSGFKSFSEPVDFSFGEPTVITGGNGRGKSSIADAIAFAVTGLPFFGERKLDRMHCDTNPNLYVSMSFIDGDGVSHTLSRSRRGSRMTIEFDGIEVRQMDLTEMFGEKDVFLSIFNPLYFIEELGDDGKDLLQRHLPYIPEETVVNELSQDTRNALYGKSLSSPEGHIRKLRKDVQELENSIIYLQGQQDLSITQRMDNEKKLTVLRESIRAGKERLTQLEGKRFRNMDVSAMEDRITELSAEYSELAGEQPDNSFVEEIDRLSLELSRKLSERQAAVFESKFTSSIAEANERVNALGARYRQEAAELKRIVPGFVCPTCRRELGKAELPHVRESFRQSISEIIAEGKEQRTQLDKLRAMEQQSRDTFEQYKAEDISKLNAELEENKTKRVKAAEAQTNESKARQDRMAELRAQIQSLTSDMEYGELTNEEYDELKRLLDELPAMHTALEAVEKAALPPAEEFEKSIAQVRKLIDVNKVEIARYAEFISKRAELSLSTLKMNRVSITLYDFVKSTGEARDCFKFTYNDRCYDRLSLSEKIRAGMEVSELVKRLTGRNYPVFVDNMESVDDLNNVRPTGQVIMAKCISNTPLNVRPVKPLVTPMPQAA